MRYQTPTCTMWNYEANKFEINPLCKVQSYTALFTTCTCKGQIGRLV